MDTSDQADGRPPGKTGSTTRDVKERLRERVRNDLRSALVDPALNPTGDFDIVVQQLRGGRGNRVAGFNGLITAMRFATMAISVLLVATSAQRDDTSLRVWTGIVILYAIFRASRPIKYSDDVASLVRVVAEVALHVLAVASTSGWDSPLLFTLLTAVTLAGLARGYGFSLRIAIATTLAVTIPYVSNAPIQRDALVHSASWTGIVVLVAVIAGYARRISGEADRERELAMDRLGRLADANTLLFSLHRVTQTLPASLDLGEVLDSTLNRMKSLVSYDSIAILLFDETDGHWDVVRHHGLQVPSRLGPTELPAGLRRAMAENQLVHIPDLSKEIGAGLNKRAGSGIYTVLPSRGSVIGLLAIEHADFEHFTLRDLDVVHGFVAPAALALDNARWFARLRTVGADEERTRIARDLHDRIGQSLAYLGIELDRIADRDAAGESITADIAQLRNDVRGVVREVRDTLYDLRTDVSEEQGLGEILQQYVARVAERSNLQIQVDADIDARLPILQEREMWRVAQEALTNVERHARATAVRVVWRCDGERALIDVTDNGVGFDQSRAGRVDSYGVLGMRERASSIGASLEIISAPGRGTRVRCTLQPAGRREGERTNDAAATTSDVTTSVTTALPDQFAIRR
ncbi:MAG TPA: GAF domain-containing sensor histidine kinase [Microthrixaceae bacterium]|jgi:signal transduction histidine kinase|nr:GAF domain-containing sensor histidine kinase [Microthrixaceae bacterium]